jgi:hypothetical protein
MGLSRERLQRVIAKRIQKRVKIAVEAALEIADEIVDDIDLAMDVASEGEGVRPIRFEREDAEQPVIPPPPPKVTVEPPRGGWEGSRPPENGEKRLLVVPGDKEFKETAADLKDLAKSTGKIRPIPLSRVQIERRSGMPERQWWVPETLIKALSESFPEKITFVPDGLDETHKITVVRNILNQAGLNIVNLEYAHPAINQDMGSTADVVKIPLVARMSFSVYDKEIDREKTMEAMLTQLRGLYKPRAPQMIPVMGYETPLRPEDAGGTDRETMRIDSNWTPQGPRTPLEHPITLSDGTVINAVNDAQPATIQRVRGWNDSETPQTARRK